MEINNMLQQSTESIRQAIGITNLKKAMHQDASTVANLLKGMQQASAKLMENSVTPGKGGNIDIRV